MITLGDSLLAKGQLFAAQFCYIVSAAEWGTFGRRSSKLVLLCSQVELLVKLLLTLCSALCHVPTPLYTAEWFTLHPHPQSTVSNPPAPGRGAVPAAVRHGRGDAVHGGVGVRADQCNLKANDASVWRILFS